MLALACDHSSSGNDTYSALFLLRFGYDENHLQVTEIASLGVGNVPTSFSVSTTGTLVINGMHPIVTLIFTKL